MYRKQFYLPVRDFVITGDRRNMNGDSIRTKQSPKVAIFSAIFSQFISRYSGSLHDGISVFSAGREAQDQSAETVGRTEGHNIS
jgi:hypothetical protein